MTSEEKDIPVEQNVRASEAMLPTAGAGEKPNMPEKPQVTPLPQNQTIPKSNPTPETSQSKAGSKAPVYKPKQSQPSSGGKSGNKGK